MFRDFIPDNDPEAGTVGAGGFQDFVPEKKPVLHPEPVTVVPTPTVPVELPKASSPFPDPVANIPAPAKKKMGRPAILK
jgi:hypothetical protein